MTRTAPVADPDLTKFQIRILAILARDEQGKCGLAIKRDLEDYYGEDVNHGRLYPNLDELADDGYLSVSARDKRTNNYQLTNSGYSTLRDELDYIATQLGFELEYGEDQEGL